LWRSEKGHGHVLMGDYDIITYSCEGLVMFMKRLPIGISDFEKLIKNDYYFVDTTKMIADVYREPSDIILITRPRRFGKTLNMSMLSYFFDNRKKTAELFEGLAVAQDLEVMENLNRFPTLFISFKDIKDRHWDIARSQLMTLLSKLYSRYEKEVASVFLNDMEKQTYQGIIYKTGDLADYKNSLLNLTEYLYRAYQKPVMLIIDEYDVPIQSGWSYGYYDEVIDFMRGLLSGALKDNSYLFRGVLTGIYRVAKESIFSGLNNLSVFTIMDKDYATYFGFTEKEVDKILQAYSVDSSEKEAVKTWYNGYHYGGHVIYNPWSILNYLRFHELKPYWTNTSSNELIQETMALNMKKRSKFRGEIQSLISGGSITTKIDDSSALRELQTKPNTIWALFLFSGYLKAETMRLKAGKYDCELKIPNEEVLIFFQDTVMEWLSANDPDILYDMSESLTKGEGERYCEELKQFISGSLSYYDIKGVPENTYHMILLGMFAHLSGGYWIKSNRESGEGRYDICLKAKDKENYSAVIEIKPSAEKTREGMEQIEERAYLQELETEGYEKILKISLGVDGKRVEAMVEETKGQEPGDS